MLPHPPTFHHSILKFFSNKFLSGRKAGFTRLFTQKNIPIKSWSIAWDPRIIEIF